jgi:hypothetical protein
MKLLKRINIPALRRIASELRGGISCSTSLDLEMSDDELFDFLWNQRQHGSNCHFDLFFVDGVIWIARFRYITTCTPPEPTSNFILRSQVATLRFLEPLAIPTPKVYKFECMTEENPVGAAYILMEKLPGSAFDYDAATFEQRIKVLNQLADYFLELEKHPLPYAGSLALAAAGNEVQGYAVEQLFSSPDKALGPFGHFESALRAILRHQMDTLVQKEYAGALLVDNYLLYMLCTENLPSITKVFNNPCKFYLRHGEDKGDHILIDADYNITGIIDWDWSTLQPAEFAFASPSMTWSLPCNDKLTKEEVALADLFRSKGRHDMSSIVRRTGLWRLLLELFVDHSLSMNNIKMRHKTLQECFADVEGVSKPYVKWKEDALEKWKDDKGLRQLLDTNDTVGQGCGSKIFLISSFLVVLIALILSSRNLLHDRQ